MCRRSLPQPFSAGEELCDSCRAERGLHRVYMSFVLRANRWHCHFLERDLQTVLPLKLQFKSHEKLRELAERGGCTLNLEARQSLDHGIEIGRGGIWLELSEEQYQKLNAGPSRNAGNA